MILLPLRVLNFEGLDWKKKYFYFIAKFYLDKVFSIQYPFKFPSPIFIWISDHPCTEIWKFETPEELKAAKEHERYVSAVAGKSIDEPYVFKGFEDIKYQYGIVLKYLTLSYKYDASRDINRYAKFRIWLPDEYEDGWDVIHSVNISPHQLVPTITVNMYIWWLVGHEFLHIALGHLDSPLIKFPRYTEEGEKQVHLTFLKYFAKTKQEKQVFQFILYDYGHKLLNLKTKKFMDLNLL